MATAQWSLNVSLAKVRSLEALEIGSTHAVQDDGIVQVVMAVTKLSWLPVLIGSRCCYGYRTA
jgi:hypothetical protein